MHRRSRAENSDSPVMPAGPCSRWTTSRSSCSPRSRSPARRSTYARGCVHARVRPPREPARDLGITRERRGGRARRRRRAGAASAWDHAARCWHCCTTSTATYRRSRRSSTTRPGAASTAGCSAGTWPRSAPGRARPSSACATSRTPSGSAATPSAGWSTRSRPSSRCRSPCRPAATHSATRSPTSSARCPRARRWATTVRAWHGSPVSDMQSFLPEPGDDEDELLIGVTDARLYFGHTHLQFRRTAAEPNGPVELVNPGSVGIPLDGDHRAAYALVGRRRQRSSSGASSTTGRRRRTRCASATATPSGSGSSPDGSSGRGSTPG